MKSIVKNIYMFFNDDEYFCDIIDNFIIKKSKIHKKIEKSKIYQFLLEEELNEL